MAKREWLIGLETELFTVDSRGRVASGADSVIKASRLGGMVKKECARNIVEILAKPSPSARDVIKMLVQNIQQANNAAHRKRLHLFPFGTYPGKFSPKMRTECGYGIKKKVFGRKFAISGRCIGFHCHYDTPSILPFAKDISILGMIDMMQQQAIINGYNFLIAADPALTCLMQSSPFYQCLNIGKDSRVIVYRGGRDLHFPLGMYADFEDFGQLQGYRHRMTDVIGSIEKRFHNWTSLIRSFGFNIRVFAKYGSILSTAWNPIKINPHNTLEERGMDMNLPSHLAAATVVIKSCLARIYEENLDVTPGNVGMRRPFFVEGDILHVPPEDYLKKILQPACAYKGMSDLKVAGYCKGLMRFASASADSDERPMLQPFVSSVRNRKTMSDAILEMAEKDGWAQGTFLSQKIARHLAIEACLLLEKDMEKTLSALE